MNDAEAKFLRVGQMQPLATSTNPEKLFAGIYLKFSVFICKQILPFYNSFSHRSKLFGDVFCETFFCCARKFSAIMVFKTCSSEFPIYVLPFP